MTNSQTKLMSFIETCVKTGLTGISACLLQIAVFPLFNIHISLHANIFIVFIFVTHSLIWNYIIRRWFNQKGGFNLADRRQRAIQKLIEEGEKRGEYKK